MADDRSARLRRSRPACASPRKGAPAPTDADDRFDDSRHPRRTLASNGKQAYAVWPGVRGSRRASRTRAFCECARRHVGAGWTLAALAFAQMRAAARSSRSPNPGLRQRGAGPRRCLGELPAIGPTLVRRRAMRCEGCIKRPIFDDWGFSPRALQSMNVLLGWTETGGFYDSPGDNQKFLPCAISRRPKPRTC